MIRFAVALAVSSAVFIPTASASNLDSVLSATAGNITIPEAANRKGSKRVAAAFLSLILALCPAIGIADRYGLNEDYGEGGGTLYTLLIGALLGAFVYEIWIHRK